MLEPNALTGAEIDRVADSRRRDQTWLQDRRHDPTARALVLGDAGVQVAPRAGGRDAVGGPDGVGGALHPVPLADVVDPDAEAAELVLLGIDDVGPLYAHDESPPRPGTRAPLVGAGGMRGEPAPDATDRLGLRSAAQGLSQAEGGLVAYAAALLNWHRANRHCGVCGAATVVAEAGMARVCGACGTHHYPRTDPVVIMLVTDDARDRVLLGRQSAWPARRYSTLAGFVSPGESLEEAVAREVLEEVGLRVGTAEYRSSQPWPFPNSLMLGFEVPYLDGAIGGTDDELEDARWFSREQVREAAADDSWDAPPEGDGLLLPPRSAIARRLIEGWLG